MTNYFKSNSMESWPSFAELLQKTHFISMENAVLEYNQIGALIMQATISPFSSE